MTDKPLVNPKNIELLRQAISTSTPEGSFLPSVFVMEPTSVCNLNCVMCPNSELEEDLLGYANLEAWNRSLDKIAPTAELIMLYFMGESTLHPDFVRMLVSARERTDARIVLSTNCLKLSPEIIDAIVGNTDLVICCIDRWNREAYEKTRRGSDFDEVVRNTKKILSANSGEASPTVVVKSLDIRYGSETTSDLQAEAEEFHAFWTDLGAVALSGWLNSWAGQMVHIRKLAEEKTPYELSERTPCADLWFKMVVNWKQEVVLCCHNYDSSVVLGTLNSSSVAEIWHSEAAVASRASQAARQFDIHICGGCREWGEPDELDAYLRLDERSLYRVF